MATRRYVSFLSVLAVLMLGVSAQAEPQGKWMAVKPLVNDESSFMISVDVDQADRVYEENELMTVNVRAEQKCYLYLLYYNRDNAVLLFPNDIQRENLIPADKLVSVPAADALFNIRTQAPFGDEVLQVIASKEKLDKIGGVAVGGVKDLAPRDLKAMVVDVKKKKKADWAEARINIKTVPAGGADKIRAAQRLAVCIGIGQYECERMNDLESPPTDARRVAEALRTQCNVDDVVLLVEQEASRANIERAIFHDLVDKSQPGDTVFIYFSGHGGRTSDTSGDDRDGMDEYLVPQDGVSGKPETMILDDVFARWVQELSGRHVVVLFDNCYSGGASKGLKGIGPQAVRGKHYDGIEVEMARAKDLGQKNTVVIAACTPDQFAWETDAHGSVLTHFLLEALAKNESDLNRDGALTVQEAYQFIERDIENYVRDNLHKEQRPMIFDNADAGILLQQR